MKKGVNIGDVASVFGNNSDFVEMYPKLSNIKLNAYYKESNKDVDIVGSYLDPTNNTLNLNTYEVLNGKNNAEQKLGIAFFHELQHQIKNIERYETGSNMILSRVGLGRTLIGKLTNDNNWDFIDVTTFEDLFYGYLEAKYEKTIKIYPFMKKQS